MRRNLLRWFFGNVLTLCALISPRLSKAFMHLQPNESIPYLFIGAFYKKELIGIAFLMIKGKSPLSAEVGIGVIDKWQGKGLGSELMGRIIVEARGLGFKKLTLEVYSSNYRGIKLYKKYRFVEKSIRRDHWGNTVIEMEKYIACPKPP
jgi:GNAT superfamily N-acetyltransferase